MKLLIDDVWPSNLKNWSYVDQIQEKYPKLEIIAFVVANYQEEELVSESKIFNAWFENKGQYIHIGVHGYDHKSPPEQERDNADELVDIATKILLPYLPERYLYRPPGFQRSIRTEEICKANDFVGIAYQRRIKYFDGRYEYNIINSHLTIDKCVNPINRWKDWLRI